MTFIHYLSREILHEHLVHCRNEYSNACPCRNLHCNMHRNNNTLLQTEQKEEKKNQNAKSVLRWDNPNKKKQELHFKDNTSGPPQDMKI